MAGRAFQTTDGVKSLNVSQFIPQRPNQIIKGLQSFM